MKARKRNSNNEWQDVAFVQLKDSDILYKQEYLEFDTLSTELKTNEQIAYEKHLQDVRERAAIAAMQSLIRKRYDVSNGYLFSQSIASEAREYADALIEQLKEN